MRALAVAFSAAFAFAATGASAITKCIDKAGKVTYQDSKCPEDSKTDALKTPIPASPPLMSTGSPDPAGAPAAPGAAAASEPAVEDPAMAEVATTQATFDNCDQAIPGFIGRNGDTYNLWRQANNATLSKYEPTPEYQKAVESRRAKFRNNVVPSSGALQDFAKTCETQFLPALKNVLRK